MKRQRKFTVYSNVGLFLGTVWAADIHRAWEAAEALYGSKISVV